MTMSDNEWQQVVQRMKTAQYISKMIAILPMTKTDTLLQGMDGCN